MELPKKTYRPNWIVIVLLAGLIVFILYLFLFVDIAQVAKTLSETNLTIYSVAFFTYMLYTLCSALVWHGLLGSLSVRITKRKAFLLTWVGLFFDATVPQLGWSAEVSKTYMLSKDSNFDSGRIGASVVGQKIFTMTITIVALSVGLGLLLFRYTFPLIETLLIGLVLGLSILTLGVVYYVSFRPSATELLLNWGIKVAVFFRKSWNPHNFRLKTEGMLGSFHLGIGKLKEQPKALVQPIFFAIAGFVFEVLVMFLAFAALGQPVAVDIVLIVFTLTGTLQTIGVAFVGLPELTMSVTLWHLGIDSSIAVSVAFLTRLVNLWFRLVVSYGALQWTGIKIIKQNKINTKYA
jgi:uncharacterized protein (TIRG00374 family)